MTRYDAIKDVLEQMNSNDLIAIHNDYCMNVDYMDDYIYCMEEFDFLMEQETPLDIAGFCFYGDFCPANGYFKFNGYGNVVSFDFAHDSNSGIDISDIAKYINDDEDALGNDDIQEILDEYQED